MVMYFFYNQQYNLKRQQGKEKYKRKSTTLMKSLIAKRHCNQEFPHRDLFFMFPSFSIATSTKHPLNVCIRNRTWQQQTTIFLTPSHCKYNCDEARCFLWAHFPSKLLTPHFATLTVSCNRSINCTRIRRWRKRELRPTDDEVDRDRFIVCGRFRLQQQKL